MPCFTRKNVRRRGFEVKCKLLVRIYSKWFCLRSVRTRFRSAHTFLKDCLSAIKMAVHADPGGTFSRDGHEMYNFINFIRSLV